MFAICSGVKCVAASAPLALAMGHEFAQNMNKTASARASASNDALPGIQSGNDIYI